MNTPNAKAPAGTPTQGTPQGQAPTTPLNARVSSYLSRFGTSSNPGFTNALSGVGRALATAAQGVAQGVAQSASAALSSARQGAVNTMSRMRNPQPSSPPGLFPPKEVIFTKSMSNGATIEATYTPPSTRGGSRHRKSKKSKSKSKKSNKSRKSRKSNKSNKSRKDSRK